MKKSSTLWIKLSRTWKIKNWLVFSYAVVHKQTSSYMQMKLCVRMTDPTWSSSIARPNCLHTRILRTLFAYHAKMIRELESNVAFFTSFSKVVCLTELLSKKSPSQMSSLERLLVTPFPPHKYCTSQIVLSWQMLRLCLLNSRPRRRLQGKFNLKMQREHRVK